jgi:hypothetical protein
MKCMGKKTKYNICYAILAIIMFSGTAMAEMGPFGLGIIIGEPTGISGKYLLDKTNAIDGAVAWSSSGNNEFYLHADYLYHNYSLTTVEKGELPVYFGLGGRVVFREKHDDKVGIRFPLGINYIFDNAPFDAFLEIVPILDLTPDTDFDLEAAIGIRYFF